MGVMVENKPKKKIVKRIKKNDQVVVVAGSNRGKKGRVIEVNPRTGKVRVEGVALMKRHVKPNPNRGVQGGIFEVEAFIDISNVMLVCPETGKPTRVRIEERDGERVRVAKKSNTVIADAKAR
jgi:large subunit ribosomal protein L24